MDSRFRGNDQIGVGNQLPDLRNERRTMTQMIDYDTIKNWPIEDVVQTYTMRDTILYALGLGFGEDPTDAGQLRFVYEKNLQAVPTLAAAIAWPKSWLRDPASGVDYVKTVHGEQDTRF